MRMTKHNSTTGVLAKVAQRANVSGGTVSRVFNNSLLIPPETRSRVLSAARELGYRPRVGVRSKQIALVTELPHKTVMGGYVNTLTQYICYALSCMDAGITMVTEDRIDNLENCWFDGIIGIAWEERTIELLKRMKNIPIVWLSDNHSAYFHTVYIDCEATGRMAGKYLYGKGHRKVAVIHEPDYTGLGRMRGLRNFFLEQGVPEEQICDLSSLMPLHLAVKQVLDSGATALWVTGEDMRVIEVNWLLQELAGVRVPDDISLLGFENPGISEFQRPSLTTIISPLRQIAEKAVELVLGAQSGELQRVEMPLRLIERNSVRTI